MSSGGKVEGGIERLTHVVVEDDLLGVVGAVVHTVQDAGRLVFAVKLESHGAIYVV